MQPFLSMIGLRPKPLEVGPRYASMNDRCMASILDVAILFLCLSTITGFLTIKIYAAFGLAPPSEYMVTSFKQLVDVIWQTRYPWAISNLMSMVFMGLLYVAFQMAYGTTPGKWLIGLTIVDATTFEPIHGWRYALRFVAYLPSSLPLMLGLMWAGFNTQHRTWHDYMAGTVVVYVHPKGWYYQQVKKAAIWLKRKVLSSPTVEQTVGQPSAEQRHDEGAKPID